MTKEIEKILGFEIEKIEKNEVIRDAEIVEGSEKYNEDETVSIEMLTGEIYYVLTREKDEYDTLNDGHTDWEFQGYYKKK